MAAITIVAYGNVTARANDSGYKSDAGSIVSMIESFNADAGRYPTSTDVSAGKLVAPSSVPSGQLTAKQPAGIYIVTTTAAPTSNKVDTTLSDCTGTAAVLLTWDECGTSTSPNYYQVKWSASGAGACVYYYQSTNNSTTPAIATAGAGCAS